MLDGKLRFGVEHADGIDRVAEKLDAHGPICVGRPYIYDASAKGELARAEDGLFADVTAGDQPLGQLFRRKIFVAYEFAAKFFNVGRGHRPLGKGPCGKKQDGPLASGRSPERKSTPFLGFGVWRDAGVRVGLEGRDGYDGGFRVAEIFLKEFKIARPSVQLRIAVYHHGETLSRLFPKPRQHVCL